MLHARNLFIRLFFTSIQPTSHTVRELPWDLTSQLQTGILLYFSGYPSDCSTSGGKHKTRDCFLVTFINLHARTVSKLWIFQEQWLQPWPLLINQMLFFSMPTYCQSDLHIFKNKLQWNLNRNVFFFFLKSTWKCLQNVCHFVHLSMYYTTHMQKPISNGAFACVLYNTLRGDDSICHPLTPSPLTWLHFVWWWFFSWSAILRTSWPMLVSNSSTRVCQRRKNNPKHSLPCLFGTLNQKHWTLYNSPPPPPPKKKKKKQFSFIESSLTGSFNHISISRNDWICKYIFLK